MIRRAGSALTKYGFQHGDVLAVCAPNSADYLVLMLAATAIGGTGTGMSAMFKESTPMKKENGSNQRMAMIIIRLETIELTLLIWWRHCHLLTCA